VLRRLDLLPGAVHSLSALVEIDDALWSPPLELNGRTRGVASAASKRRFEVLGRSVC
jgi:hypothetical protein